MQLRRQSLWMTGPKLSALIAIPDRQTRGRGTRIRRTTSFSSSPLVDRRKAVVSRLSLPVLQVAGLAVTFDRIVSVMGR